MDRVPSSRKKIRKERKEVGRGDIMPFHTSGLEYIYRDKGGMERVREKIAPSPVVACPPIWAP